MFANRLSERDGLAPVYDFDSVEWQPGTSAEAGNLCPRTADPLHIEPLAPAFAINAPEGDIYRAKGYRLPTRAEWEYVLRDLGKSASDVPFGLPYFHLLDPYAWTSENSQMRLHAVATASPFLVEGRTFYDLAGNVYKWLHDTAGDRDERAVVGGSFRRWSDHMTLAWTPTPSNANFLTRGIWGAAFGNPEVGFRLVKSLP